MQGYSESVVQHQLESAIVDRREWLRGLTILLHENGINVVIKVVRGISFLEIIRQVLREQHDLVIATAEEKKGIHARLFGTISMHLMRKCPCPVWVVKRAQVKPYTRILAAVAPSVYDSNRDSLNPLILQLASSMARSEAAELYIVHVWSLSDYDRIKCSTENEVQKAKEHMRTKYKQFFDNLLDELGITDLNPHVYLIEGEPDERISALVDMEKIDLLVMGTVCRTGIAGFLIGNTAEEVLSQVDCAVLTIKPEGFVTPVTLG